MSNLILDAYTHAIKKCEDKILLSFAIHLGTVVSDLIKLPASDSIDLLFKIYSIYCDEAELRGLIVMEEE